MVKKPIKILIAGDSFAAFWPNAVNGWPNLLSQKYNVTNIAEAGVGEYKIWKQIKNANIDEFDLVIVSHTSPNRVHTIKHPIHKTDLHKNCDLIYTDIEAHSNWFNPSLAAAKGWFEHHYDQEYQNDIYRLLRESILKNITKPYISLNNLEVSLPFVIEPNSIDFSKLWKTERGVVNHYTTAGNKTVFNAVDLAITKVL